MKRPQMPGPEPNVTYACAQKGVEKRAALLYDRILTSQDEGLKDYVPYVPAELALSPPCILWDDLWDTLRELIDSARHLEAIGHPFSQDIVREAQKEVSLKPFVRALQASGYAIAPVYLSDAAFHFDHPVGPAAVYQAAITEIPDIDEAATSWDEILEFRHDAAALGLYRAFRLWANDAVKAESVAHAQDLIGQRLENREWALRKHGFNTVVGSMTSILSWDGLASVAGSAGLAAYFASPRWAAISAGGVIVAKSALWLAQRNIERAELARSAQAEVAIICEARRRLQNAGDEPEGPPHNPHGEKR
jgi:hypothetical protein